MAKSIGEALMKGIPVVFTVEGRVPEVVCEPGKEQQALEMLEKMGFITLLRPQKGNLPQGALSTYDEQEVCSCGEAGRHRGLKIPRRKA